MNKILIPLLLTSSIAIGQNEFDKLFIEADSSFQIEYNQEIEQLKINTNQILKKMADYKKKPRITSSKKQCKCDETGVQIEKFDKILFDPVQKKVYCQDSSAYEQHIIQLESLHNH